MAVYRDGLWSRRNFPETGQPLVAVARRIVRMRLEVPRRNLQGLMAEIRNGRWASMAMPLPDHRQAHVDDGDPVDRTVVTRRIAPNRYVLEFLE